MTETVYLAIYENEAETITVEYVPMPNGCIEIVSASVVRKPVSQWEQREATRRPARYVQPRLDEIL